MTLCATTAIPIATSNTPPTLHRATLCWIALPCCSSGARRSGCVRATTHRNIWTLWTRGAKPLVTCLLPTSCKCRADELLAHDGRRRIGRSCSCCYRTFRACTAEPVLASHIPTANCRSAKSRQALTCCCGGRERTTYPDRRIDAQGRSVARRGRCRVWALGARCAKPLTACNLPPSTKVFTQELVALCGGGGCVSRCGGENTSGGSVSCCGAGA